MRGILFFTAALWAIATSAEAHNIRDGRLFDPGLALTAPSANAPEETAELSAFVGDWHVEMLQYRADQAPLIAKGRARVTFMNRGHGLLERTRISDFDGQGHDLATLSFIAATRAGQWSWSESNSWQESIEVFTGQMLDQALILTGSARPGGGMAHQLVRRTFSADGQQRFVLHMESSADFGTTWVSVARRIYTRAVSDAAFFPVADDYGSAAEGLPKEAHEFDFIIGEFDAQHWQPLPTGPQSWPGNATAVRVMDGHALMEVVWQDNNPVWPDSSITILRIYNRAMRRWESLFLNNRQNTPLYFGGVRENDRIVLHPFAAHSGNPAHYQWIFFDVREHAYRWKGLQSSDRGEHWQPHWLIEFQRKDVAAPDYLTAAPEQVVTVAADGTQVFGDHYRSGKVASPTVLLFHQAGGDARGEYTEIARRLLKEGYEVFAWDARSGGDRFGQSNRTVASLNTPVDSYCAAYPDLESALQYAVTYGSGGPLLAIGSSYSAALLFRLEAEHGATLNGMAAFSPASGRMDDCDVAQWLPERRGTSALVLRPQSEMENPSVQAQRQLLESADIELFIADPAVHGASMLSPERSKGDVEATWQRLLRFLSEAK